MIQADFVELALGATETTETSLGTVTIPNTGVKRIIGVYGVDHGVETTGEEASGYFRLQFKTVPGTFKFPAQVFNAGAGTLVGPASGFDPKIIPVDIPVPPNESVTCYMAQFVASTGARRGVVGLLME